MAQNVLEFYENDVVYRFDRRKRIEFGVVIDTYESCDTYDTQLLCKGQLLVEWLGNRSGEKTRVLDRSKVHLLSRSVGDGDIVRRLEDGKETQRGYCRSVKLRTVVQILGSNQVIDNISHDRLAFVHPFNRYAPVCIGETVGRVLHCDYQVKLTGIDGSTVEFIPDDSKPYFKHLNQAIEVVPANLKRAKWLRKTWSLKQNMFKPHHFTIQAVKPVAITVAIYDESHSTYALTLNKEDISHLKVLPTLDTVMPQFDELRYLAVRASDVPLPQSTWIAQQSSKYRTTQLSDSARCQVVRKKPRCPANRCYEHRPYRHFFFKNVGMRRSASAKEMKDSDWITDEEEEELPACAQSKRSLPLNRPIVVQAMTMESKATIVWQDGTVEVDVPTTQLYYSISLDDHEFFPGEWVVRADEGLDCYGVVQRVDYLERTAQVKWFTCTSEMSAPVVKGLDELSVYDIKRHTTFVFRPGSVVFRVKPCENNLGTVIDSYPEGYVRVHWMTGVEENCWPQHIDMLGENWGCLDSSEGEDLDSSLHSWETESVESVYGETDDSEPWQMLASRLEFMRGRISYLRQALLERDWDSSHDENLSFLKNLLSVYENLIYLDKLLDTQLFSIHSSHYQTLLGKIKEKAREAGIEIRSKLPVDDLQAAELQLMRLECRLELQRFTSMDTPASGESAPIPAKGLTTGAVKIPTYVTNTSLSVELLSMLKCRMDLAYAEVISRIGGPQALSVLTVSSRGALPSSLRTLACSTPIPSSSTTPDDSLTSITTPPPKLADCGITVLCDTPSSERRAALGVARAPNQPFEVLEEVPAGHRYFESVVEPADPQRFCRAIVNEHVRLAESLPPGVWVYGFSSRTDLYSVMIRGPNNTPYEDGLFIFDLQLSADYPRSPPHCSYISYNSERLNPNLYVEGRVCVSLLGTWIGRGTEVWGPKSTLLQLIVSIQGLILVAEPYFNEAGYDKQNDTQQGFENSRTYNELVILRLVQSMTSMLESPHEVFRKEIYQHFRENGAKMVRRLAGWIDGSFDKEPDFPLLPPSKGLKLSLRSCLDRFQSKCAEIAATFA